jgi:hypothetical protein
VHCKSDVIPAKTGRNWHGAKLRYGHHLQAFSPHIPFLPCAPSMFEHYRGRLEQRLPCFSLRDYFDNWKL